MNKILLALLIAGLMAFGAVYYIAYVAKPCSCVGLIVSDKMKVQRCLGVRIPCYGGMGSNCKESEICIN